MVVQIRSYLGWYLTDCSRRVRTGGPALAEIELYGELVIAASASDEPLSSDEIDRVLGLERAGDGEARTA